jgi:hypothetical protein
VISGVPISALPVSSSGEVVSFNINAEFSATIEDCALAAAVSVAVVANLTETVEDCALISAAAQVGDGTLALFAATIEDCELNAEASVLIASGLDATLEDCVLSALGVTGSLGPFTRRPFLVLN